MSKQPKTRARRTHAASRNDNNNNDINDNNDNNNDNNNNASHKLQHGLVLGVLPDGWSVVRGSILAKQFGSPEFLSNRVAGFDFDDTLVVNRNM